MKSSLIFLSFISWCFLSGCEQSDMDKVQGVRLVKVIAHRGASGYELENSLSAFKKAVDQGSDYIELDIWKTTDDSLVVFHDKNTGRLTNHSLIIPYSSFAQLRALTLRNGECIPSLREVLSILSDTTGVFVDIKCCWEPGPPGEVFPFLGKILQETGFIDRTVVLSSNAANATDVNYHISGVPFYLSSNQKDNVSVLFQKDSFVMCDGLNLHYGVLDEVLIKMALENQLSVTVWGVNNTTIARKMMDFRVEGITTDYPDKIIEAVTR